MATAMGSGGDASVISTGDREGWEGLDTSALPALTRASLLQLLDNAPGAAAGEGVSLFLDPQLAASLGLIVDVASLKQHRVERMFWLEDFTSEPSPSSTQETKWRTKLRAVAAPTRSVVYICRPEPRWMHVLAGHILADVQASAPGAGPSQLMHNYTLLFAPQRTELCLTALAGGAGFTPSATQEPEAYRPSVLPYLTIQDFALEFVPLAPDLLSLELPNAWKELYIEGLTSSVFSAAQALMTLQFAYGLFPRIIGKGDLAECLTSMLLSQREEQLSSDPTSPALTSCSTDMDALIIIDRGVDQVTPLCTQLTYEGLLDEVFGISASHVEVPGADSSSNGGGASGSASASAPLITPGNAPNQKKHKHHLSVAKDSVYQTLRDANFAIVGPLLHEEAVKLNAEYEARRSDSTQQLRAFVRRLPILEARRASTTMHTHAAGLILNASREPEVVRALETEQALVAGPGAASSDEAGSKAERALLETSLAAISEMIDARESLERVVRLLCLASLTTSGLSPTQFDSFRSDICQVYGYEALPLLLRLEQAGLLRRAAGAYGTKAGFAANLGNLGLGALSLGLGGRTKPTIPSRLSSETNGSEPTTIAPVCPFGLARRPLKLINDEVDESDPSDIAYVHSGYAPLSIRLVQAAGMKQAFLSSRSGPTHHPPRKAHRYIGWQGFEEIVSALPGSVVDVLQPAHPPPLDLDDSDSVPGNPSKPPSSLPPLAGLAPENGVKTTVVFFVGGVTYAEVAALRFMSRQLTDRKFLIATTNIISGSRIVQSADHLGAAAPWDLAALGKSDVRA